jgi:hypothetical protein
VAIVEEAALRRFPGDDALMREQIEHLISMSECPNITVQIMPLRAGIPTVPAATFTTPRFTEDVLSDVVYLQHLTSATYVDKASDVDSYRRLMDALALTCLSPPESVRFLKKKSWRRIPPSGGAR